MVQRYEEFYIKSRFLCKKVYNYQKYFLKKSTRIYEKIFASKKKIIIFAKILFERNILIHSLKNRRRNIEETLLLINK